MRYKEHIELLTEKGKVKTEIRARLLKKVDGTRELFAKAKKIKNGQYEIPVSEPDGQVVYIKFSVSVSEKSFTECSDGKPKKASAETESIEIE